MGRYTIEEVASRIQHTNVSPDASLSDIEKLCKECVEYGFNAAVINPIWVKEAKRFLQGTDVKVCVALNFPIGASTTLAKVVEVRNVIADGCDEIDFMINVGYLKSRLYELFKQDLEEVVKASDGRVTKAILETAILTEEEIRKAAKICEEVGVQFIKNSTGWGKSSPATVDIIKLMRASVSQRVKIKASGGIRDFKKAVELLEAGADLLGTSSGVQIIRGVDEGSEVRY